jgi:sigma-B regulation protein RsbU (phosphoserine phosphatase)
MDTAVATALRGQLIDRRRRLEDSLRETGQVSDLVALLQQVDAALSRMEDHTYGGCKVCGETVDKPYLLANPFLEYCLCRLDEKQMTALQHDIDLAQRIQAGLLPRQDLECCGWLAHYRYEAAGPVSGDYCDILSAKNGEGDLYFTMADVSGKGISAALLMAHLNASFRSLIDVDLPLSEIVARQNRMFLATGLPSHYATLVLGRADGAGGLEICNAGHVPPLLLREGEVQAVGTTGFPVGMVGDRSYEVVRATLEPGDSLFLYTDGLVEARGDADVEFGEDRLKRLLHMNRRLTPRALADACLADLRDHLKGVPHTDDMTLMVVRRES